MPITANLSELIPILGWRGISAITLEFWLNLHPNA